MERRGWRLEHAGPRSGEAAAPALGKSELIRG